MNVRRTGLLILALAVTAGVVVVMARGMGITADRHATALEERVATATTAAAPRRSVVTCSRLRLICVRPARRV